MTPAGGLAGRLQRRRGSAPDRPRDVVLVVRPGIPLSTAAFAAAAGAGKRGVAVLAILQIHGYGLGLPNPGLMPNARERATAEESVGATVRRLTSRGVSADGHIIVTRKAAKAIAETAKRRDAGTVVLDRKPVGVVRQALEGDVSRQLRRRLGDERVQTFSSTAVHP